MFVDLPHYWSPPEPPRRRQPPKLTKRQEKVLGWIIGFNLVMLFVAPLAGVTMFDVVLALLRH
jgi:hypothetical protein